MFRKVPHWGTKVPSVRALLCPAEEHIERWWMGIGRHRGSVVERMELRFLPHTSLNAT